ncbi:MAG TPA: AraC family transcriptional regulator [Blastocatellia bacterium]|nr:AraC family transcriptional regulator [Blastocatellia bacterium]
MEIKLSLGKLHPTLVKEFRTRGLRLSESVYPAHLQTPRHSHEQAYFCLILSGTSVQSCGSKRRERKPGTTLFYLPDELHWERFGETEGRIFSVEVGPEWLEKLRECSLVQRHALAFEGGRLSWLAGALYREMVNPDGVAPLAIEGLTLEILAEAARRRANTARPKVPRWLAEAKDLLHAEFAEDLSLDCIARRVGIHPVHLATTFRKCYGSTVGAYVRRLRIEFALQEVASTDRPLAQVAVAAGFSNQAHFTKVFKQHTGMTPARYRAAAHFS